MKAFNVWVSRTEGATGVRVEALGDALWLIRRLSDSFVFKTCEPVSQRHDSQECTFRVALNSQLSGPRLERLLAGISEVRMFRDTEPSDSTPIMEQTTPKQ